MRSRATASCRAISTWSRASPGLQPVSTQAVQFSPTRVAFAEPTQPGQASQQFFVCFETPGFLFLAASLDLVLLNSVRIESYHEFQPVVPEPATGLLVLAGVIDLAERRIRSAPDAAPGAQSGLHRRSRCAGSTPRG